MLPSESVQFQVIFGTWDNHFLTCLFLVSQKIHMQEIEITHILDNSFKHVSGMDSTWIKYKPRDEVLQLHRHVRSIALNGHSRLATFASELEGNFERLMNDKWITVSFYFSYYHQEKYISRSNTTYKI